MALPMDLGSFGRALHAGDHHTIHSRLSKITEKTGHRRMKRNAVLRSKKRSLALPDEVQKFQATNPEAFGLPRSYKLSFQDVLSGQEGSSVDGPRIIFGQFGSETGGMTIDDYAVQAKDISYDISTKSYHIVGLARSPQEQSHGVTGFFDFNSAAPTGTLGTSHATYNAVLNPQVLQFSVKVSASAGVYYSSGSSKLIFDPESNDWKTAVWEDTMEFGYDVKVEQDEVLGHLVYIENFFTDKASTPAVTYSLPSTKYGSTYTSIMDGTAMTSGSLLTTIVSDTSTIPAPAASRATGAVHSVFPQTMSIKFSEFGDSFVGAYLDKDRNAYAVQGMVIPDADVGTLSNLATPTVSLSNLSNPAMSLPVENIFAFTEVHSEKLEDPVSVLSVPKHASHETSSEAPDLEDKMEVDGPVDFGHKLFPTVEVAEIPSSGEDIAPLVAEILPSKDQFLSEKTLEDAPGATLPRPHAFLGASGPALGVQGLLNLSPMVPDANDPSGFRDSVGQLSMKDFHDIIVYYMDDDLRKVFVSELPIVLTPGVKAIADDDLKNNKPFYKSLQVPYLATFLAGGSTAEGKQVNGARAEKLLKTLPTDDPVYKRHSSKLYRLRFLQKFSGVQAYLDDQRKTDYSSKIDQIAATMKTNLTNSSANIASISTTYQADLQKAKADIDSLATWAKAQRCYWAFMLLYWVQKSALPNWYGQYTSGGASSSLGISIKKLNGTFGVLESDQANPDGINFMQAFNKSIEVFQMTSIIPQMVDLEGNASDFDTLLKASLLEFYNHYKDTQDMTDRAAESLQLWAQDQLRKNFYTSLFSAQRLARAAGTWNHVMTMFYQEVHSSPYWVLVEGGTKLLEMFGYMSVVVMMFMPLVAASTGAGGLTPQMMVTWIGSIVAVGAFVVANVALGVLRLYTFWSQISGFWNCLGVLTGIDYIFENILPSACQYITNTITQWFVRTSYEAQDIFLATNLSKLEATFGRNLGELVSSIAGIIMSIAIIVMTAINLAQETSALMIAADAIFIATATIQILTIAAGWIIYAIETAAVGGFLASLATMIPALTLVSTWGGPVGLAFALVGFLIFIIWIALVDRRNPFQLFVDDHVKPAGLYMEHLAVDYFTDIPATDKSAQLVGVSIRTALAKSPSYPNPQPANLPNGETTGASKVYLRLDGSSASPTIQYSTDLLYTNTDVWSLYTDAYGKSVIATKLYNEAGASTIYFLATTEDGTSVVPISLPPKSDEALYKKALAKAQWTVTSLQDPTTAGTKDGKEKQPLSMQVSIKKGNLTLGVGLQGPTYGPNNIFLYDDSKTPPQPLAYAFMLEMQPMGPGQLSYQSNPWVLTAGEADEQNLPKFVPDNTSQGLKWTISPALDPQFELVTTPGAYEGSVRSKTGVVVTQMASKTYTITCSLTVGGIDIKRITQLSIQVDAGH